jgi:hypothetical protein
VDAVLGLSVTPSAVGLVLVEGQDADGPTVDRNAFEILPGRGSTPRQTSEQAAAAVLRTEAIAATHGHRLHSIGVTWSDNADTEAALLLKSLTDCGFDNVVPIRLPEATEALAWGIAEVIGHEITAVCVIEPDSVIALIVHTREGAVQTAVNHTITTQEDLIGWLSAVFTRADWQPEALVVVGTGGNFDSLMPRLEDALAVPVFAPEEAELALARGAALASAQSDEFSFSEYTEPAAQRNADQRRWPTHTAPLAMLAAGAVTFVISLSVAVSLQMAPDRTASAESRPAASITPADAVKPAPGAESTPASAGLAETPEAPVAVTRPPEVVSPAAEPPAAVEAPAQQDVPPEGSAPVQADPPEAPAAPEQPSAPVEAPPPQDPALAPAPGLVPAVPTPVPEHRGLLQRIRDRLANDGPGNQAPPPPEAAPAPSPVAPPS